MKDNIETMENFFVMFLEASNFTDFVRSTTGLLLNIFVGGILDVGKLSSMFICVKKKFVL